MSKVLWSWTHRIGVCPEGGSPTEHLDNMHRAIQEETNRGFYMTHLDREGNSLIHAFISLIDACSMEASRVQEILEVILRHNADVMELRNARGETPLHLAVRRALPHVVTLLLQHISWDFHGLYDRDCNLPDSKPSREQIERLRRAIHVCNAQEVTLFTDLHFVYWVWRMSTEEAAMHYEIDALLCIRIIVDALAGRLPAKGHKFRSLRSSHNLPDQGKEADERGLRSRGEKESKDHDQDLQETSTQDLQETFTQDSQEISTQTRRFRRICAKPERAFRDLAVGPQDREGKHTSRDRASLQLFDNGWTNDDSNVNQSELDMYDGQEASERDPYNDCLWEESSSYYDASHPSQTTISISDCSHFRFAQQPVESIEPRLECTVNARLHALYPRLYASYLMTKPL
jgi:hypothetical protein